MTRQWNLFGKLVNRTALGLMAAGAMVAAAALYTPIAQASPQSDATDAINAAWDAAGGDTSQLGPRDGDVYAVGAGFGQNFAGGAIFFSPATGAKAMFGAILDKYRALGGPADSDLGFPTIDEGAGKISPDSRNTTFSAGDNPVIFWTPDSGAWVVRGPINAAWDKLGGSAGGLGVPIADESYSGDVVSQKFTGGELSFDTRTKMFTTDPPDLAGQLAGLNIPTDATSAIAAAYRAAGGSSGPLGAKQGDQYAVGDTGAGQNFAGGKVFFSPDTGAYAVTGDILAKYEKAGGPTGDLGFPTGGESDGGVPDSRVSTFAASDNPVIFWTKDHGAVVVRGAMKAAWDKLGGATGALGAPVDDQNTEGATVTQKFTGGQVSWDSKANKFTTDPANLAEQLSGLQVPAGPTPSTPAVPPAPEKDNAFAWHGWWLWWIIPLALLLLGSLFAWTTMRRRRGAGAEREFDDEVEVGPGYDESPEEGGPWAARGRYAERDVDADTDQEPSGYLSSRMGWSEQPEPTPPQRFEDVGLFTHHGAHAADAEDEESEEEDPDSVDTAPTRIPTAEDDEQRSGRHAVQRPNGPRSMWTAPDNDSYLPGPGSLFAPVYGAAPPPRRGFGDDRDEGGERSIRDDEDEDFLGDADGDTERYMRRREDQPERGEADRDDSDQSERGDADRDESDQADQDRDEARADGGDAREERARGESAAPPAIHLPLDDPDEAPDGYPIKGSMRTGKYHAPGSPGYDKTVAEIWFASEESAERNGFAKAD